MAWAPSYTTGRGTAVDCRPMAYLEAAQSSFASHDADQKGGATTRRLSRLHGVGVWVHENPENTRVLPNLSRSLTFTQLLLKTGAGFGRRPFQPHSHWPFPSRSADRRLFYSSGFNRLHLRACAVTGCTSPFIALRSPGWRRPSAQSLAHQKLVDLISDAPHVQILSSSLSLVSSQTSEAHDGRVPKPRAAFHKNEGELPNVGS